MLQAYRLTSFCEARLLLELRVLAYGLSLTDRPTAVHEMQSPEPDRVSGFRDTRTDRVGSCGGHRVGYTS